MKTYFNFITFLLILFLSSEIAEAQRIRGGMNRGAVQQISVWQGSWETSFGELQLHP